MTSGVEISTGPLVQKSSHVEKIFEIRFKVAFMILRRLSGERGTGDGRQTNGHGRAHRLNEASTAVRGHDQAAKLLNRVAQSSMGCVIASMHCGTALCAQISRAASP